MWSIKLLFLVTLWCSAFESVQPTTVGLFNALKIGVQKTRCKLHEIGSKIVHHEHRHGDPCEAVDQNPDQHGDNRIENYDKLPVTENLQPDYGNNNQIGLHDNQPQYLNGHSYGPRRDNPTGQASWGQYRPDRDHRGNDRNYYEPIAPFNHPEPQPFGPGFVPDHHRQQGHHVDNVHAQGNYGQNINPWQSGSASYGNSQNNGYFGQNVKPFGQESYSQVNTQPSIQRTTGTDGNGIGFSGQASGISFEQTTEKKSIDNIEDNSIFKSEPDDASASAEDIAIQSKATTEKYPTTTTLDIDIRMAEPGTTTTKSTKKFATVPTDGGRNLGKAPCKDGKVDTGDGCMEAI